MEMILYIVNLGTSVMMPVIFFVLALLAGVRLGKAFQAALLVGIGFEGLNLVINLLMDHLGPAANAMVERMGVELRVLDTGWPVAATVGWGSPIMAAGVILLLLVNGGMIAAKWTNTVDIDIFNYWIFLCEGALIYAITQNAVLSLAIMGILFAFLLKVGDWTAKRIGEEFQVSGMSFPHLTAAPYILFGMAANAIFEKIPGLNKLRMNPEKVNQRLGVLGDPAAVGAILGAAIALLAGYEVGNVLMLAIKVAAAMVLLPKMTGILVEGLNIVRTAVEEKLSSVFPGRTFYIGMDVAILVADPTVLAVGVLLIPITLVLAVALPGNQVLPFVDLPSLIFMVAMMAAYCRRDLLRTLAAGTVMMVFVLYAATDAAGVYSAAARMANAAFPEGMELMSALNVGFVNPLGWAVWKLVSVIQKMVI